MKATELRIGNLILEYGETSTIYHLDNGGNTYSKINDVKVSKKTGLTDADHERFAPIPLSKEWLESFGWVWNEECNSYEKYPNGDARMNLASIPYGSYTMFNYVTKALICERIYHVHQLQNLYFALTGEELEIKSINKSSNIPE